MYTAFMLNEQQRADMIKDLPFSETRLIAEHVTLVFGEHDPALKNVSVVAYAMVKTRGLQYLLCEIDGQRIRADGVPYHITWSIDPAFKPKDTGIHAKSCFKEIDYALSDQYYGSDVSVMKCHYDLKGEVVFYKPKSKVKINTHVKSAEYDVIEHSTLQNLIEKVNAKLQEGWQCQGHAIYVESKATYMQTLTKHNKG